MIIFIPIRSDNENCGIPKRITCQLNGVLVLSLLLQNIQITLVSLALNLVKTCFQSNFQMAHIVVEHVPLSTAKQSLSSHLTLAGCNDDVLCAVIHYIYHGFGSRIEL
ncbi:hypothetical protein chiPu_0011375 [Chiloscyllium punctatum]|uniref:Uncharacterized protein n=1 Tax=Chiloscyllium punctatum TaxID=137246 RepID=A0A401SR89_CHIPU|nr:hypothetical protein [Chiloscyllium punctatum]